MIYYIYMVHSSLNLIIIFYIDFLSIYMYRYISIFFFFFFKQKTAYEMLRSLVGSEMCIRDRTNLLSKFAGTDVDDASRNTVTKCATLLQVYIELAQGKKEKAVELLAVSPVYPPLL
eukprot:TRINITY_DN24427_c0_g1_i1.p1 TRINITY_DN24427_c0_g1~~TRINITY_DN24427_c0_g1_i1.p1  ORF type:complete len:117 (-),score=28.02 TRINITY_DN24427_c0_g1_i1:260-610(-)